MSRIGLTVIALVLVLCVDGQAQDVAEPGASPAGTPLIPTAAAASVVTPERLIPILPAAPAGWSADKPDGSTTESQGFQITTVGTTYVQGTADAAPTTSITIIDSANNQQFQDATKAMWSATGTTADGFDKAVTISGLPGFEHFSNSDQSGVLWVIAGGRFFVQVETTHQTVAELEAWLGKMNLKSLSTMK